MIKRHKHPHTPEESHQNEEPKTNRNAVITGRTKWEIRKYQGTLLWIFFFRLVLEYPTPLSGECAACGGEKKNAAGIPFMGCVILSVAAVYGGSLCHVCYQVCCEVAGGSRMMPQGLSRLAQIGYLLVSGALLYLVSIHTTAVMPLSLLHCWACTARLWGGCYCSPGAIDAFALHVHTYLRASPSLLGSMCGWRPRWLGRWSACLSRSIWWARVSPSAYS